MHNNNNNNNKRNKHLGIANSIKAADPAKFLQLPSGKNFTKNFWIWVVIRISTKIEQFAANEISHPSQNMIRIVNNFLSYQQRSCNCLYPAMEKIPRSAS